MRIEVVYALAQEQVLLVLNLPPAATVQDALEASGLLRQVPQIELARVGVWGKLAARDTRLRDRDRVEIYRPLLADPKDIRRNRAARKRSRG